VTDAGILGRLRSQSSREEAFDELVRDLRTQLFAVCLHVTGSASDADDALQETLLAMHTGLPGFRGESSLSTWAHRIAIRCALRLRARRAEPAALDEHFPAQRGPDTLLAAEFGEQLAAALQRLPAEHRVVLSLFAVDGLSHAQIAEILGLPEGTVWSRLHAARKRLAAQLGT
jgi:RNA polymerase sigma-70 factor (ECF subfamily)